GLCLFVAFATLDIPDANQAVTDMVNAKYGWSLGADDVAALGQKVLGIERDFNVRAGFNAADDRLPDFFRREKLPPHDLVFDVPDADLDRTLKF
ncbi:MAG: aldehyde ferredoxin oxidoreductase C-terminal domain-containing protein, partial [Proteobacteria bacterium]|nr:aldehyde ferredoxin oxidoreductase C-terminal domain-containing protein [Pseudomonadota bacterium]